MLHCFVFVKINWYWVSKLELEMDYHMETNHIFDIDGYLEVEFRVA